MFCVALLCFAACDPLPARLLAGRGGAVQQEEVARTGGGRDGSPGDVEGVRGGGGLRKRCPPAPDAAAQGEGWQHLAGWPYHTVAFLGNLAQLMVLACLCVALRANDRLGPAVGTNAFRRDVYIILKVTLVY